MKIYFERINFYLLLFFPLIFILGNAILNFYILILLFYLFFYKIQIYEMIQSNKKISIFIFFAYLYFIANAIFISKNLNSVIFALGMIKIIVLFIFMKITFQCSKKKLNKIFKLWIYFFLFLAFDALIQLFFGRNILGMPSEIFNNIYNCENNIIIKLFRTINIDFQKCPNFLITNRLSGVFGNELVIGSFLSYFFNNIFGATLNIKKIKISLLLCILFFLAIIYSGERMAFLFFVGSLVLFLFLKFSLKKLFYFLILILISYFVISTSSSIHQRFKEIEQINKKFIENPKSDLPYLSIWRYSIYNFENNYFFGVGIKNYRNSCKTVAGQNFVADNFGKNACTNHPHNFYLEILAETGLFGFFIIFYFFSYILLKIFKIYQLNKKNYMIIFSLISAISILQPFKTSGSIFSTFFGLLFFFLLFLSYYISKLYNSNKPSVK